MERVPPRHRPHYPAVERLAILELRAARGWSAALSAKRFFVTEATIADWMARLDAALSERRDGLCDADHRVQPRSKIGGRVHQLAGTSAEAHAATACQPFSSASTPSRNGAEALSSIAFNSSSE